MSAWLPRRDLIAVIVRYEDRHAPALYRLAVWGDEVGRYGSLATARIIAEAEVGERLRWEQVSGTRHEAWSHRE